MVSSTIFKVTSSVKTKPEEFGDEEFSIVTIFKFDSFVQKDCYHIWYDNIVTICGPTHRWFLCQALRKGISAGAKEGILSNSQTSQKLGENSAQLRLSSGWLRLY